METRRISKEEYKKLKKNVEVDWELFNEMKRGLEDIRNGRIKEWKFF